jgi:hypothetical protein
VEDRKFLSGTAEEKRRLSRAWLRRLAPRLRSLPALNSAESPVANDWAQIARIRVLSSSVNEARGTEMFGQLARFRRTKAGSKRNGQPFGELRGG